MSVDCITVDEYFYDGEGKRVKKKKYEGGVLDEETVFVYSSGKLIAEYSSKPPTQNPTTSFTITDQLGSPRVLVNTLGQVVSRRDFLPFGEEIVPDAANLRTDATLKYNGDTVRQKFTGYQKDEESGLDFAEARMYQNLHGRFTAIDPLLASGKSVDPQTFNRYVYVRNSPIVIKDPTGMIGDYFSYSGVWLGHDGKDDGKVYFATEIGRNGDNVDLDRRTIRKTTLGEVLKAQDRAVATTPGTDNMLQALGAEVTQGVYDGFVGTAKGCANFCIGVWNASTQIGGPALEGIIPNPVAFDSITYDNDRQGDYGSAAKTGFFVGTLLTGGALATESSVSVVPKAPTGFAVTPEGVVLSQPKFSIPPDFVQSPYRSSSYGEMINGKYVERIRIDPATQKYPTHYHVDRGKEHLYPGSTKGDPGFPNQ